MIEIKVDRKVLGVKTLLKGKVKRIIVKKYYDLNGSIINEGQDMLDYRREREFEITSTKEKMYGKTFNWWNIKVNGKSIDDEWELTSYKFDKQNKQLILEGCTGAG